MAGASVAAELAPHARVVLLEAEERPGYHATGRSAAFWAESYGGPLVQPLTTASGPYLAQNGFLSERGALNIAREDQPELVREFLAEFSASGVRMEVLGEEAVAARLPGLRSGWREAVWEPDCRDIDVGGLHAHYLALCRQGGVRTLTRFRLASAERRHGTWVLASDRGEALTCDTLVDAAGAWADDVAILAGVRPLGIAPYRRTVVQLRTDPAPEDDLPLVVDLAGSFYFKPESGRLWLSPHDETPSPAVDAAPEELDVALAIDRFEKVVDWRVLQVEHRWAGLRSFAPDRLPVYGRDPGEPSFFWFAGQGGFGIQTAPAAARLAAGSLLGLDGDALTAQLDAERYSPARFG